MQALWWASWQAVTLFECCLIRLVSVSIDPIQAKFPAVSCWCVILNGFQVSVGLRSKYIVEDAWCCAGPSNNSNKVKRGTICVEFKRSIRRFCTSDVTLRSR
jgi:hypothetical protein